MGYDLLIEQMSIACAKHICARRERRGHQHVVVWIMRHDPWQRERQLHHQCAGLDAADELGDFVVASPMQTTNTRICQHAGQLAEEFE